MQPEQLLPDFPTNPAELEIVPVESSNGPTSAATERPALTVVPSGKGMRLVSVTYVQNGTKLGKRGRPIKTMTSRCVLLCQPCGKQIVRLGRSALSARSCGCLGRPKKHGLAKKHPLYAVWHGMKDRCLNPNSSAAARYSQRGITMCPEWKEFVPFYNWAIKAGWKKGLVFDRRDNDGNYEPANCRFISVLESNRNRSNVTINVTQALAIRKLLDVATDLEIAVGLKVPVQTLENMRRGYCWKPEDLKLAA